MALSFAMFPERNTLTLQHIAGAGVFFLGLIVRTVMKEDTDRARVHSNETGASSSARDSSNSAGASYKYGWSSLHRSASLALSYGDLTSLLNRKDDQNNNYNNHNNDNSYNHNHNILSTGDKDRGKRG